MTGKDTKTEKNLLDTVDTTVIDTGTGLGDETTFVLSKMVIHKLTLQLKKLNR